jgi:hypothetical protein
MPSLKFSSEEKEIVISKLKNSAKMYEKSMPGAMSLQVGGLKFEFGLELLWGWFGIAVGLVWN